MTPIYLTNGKFLTNNGQLAMSTGCCCDCGCIEYTFDAGIAARPNGGNPPGGGCPEPLIFNTQTITIPESCKTEGSSSTTVTITGFIDDEIVIDGEVVQAGEYIDEPDCFGIINGCDGCNGAHIANYTFEVPHDPGSFTIAVGDNHGATVAANLYICFNGATPPSNP